MLELLTQGIWTEEVPQRFIGLEMSTRMSVVRLSSGEVLLYSAIAATPERRAAVRAIGPVRHVVAPSQFHHLYAGEWIAACPDATVWAAPGLVRKRPDLRIDRRLGHDAAPWADELEPIPLAGIAALEETMLWHAESRTLLACDLLQSYVGRRGGPWTRLYFALAGLTAGPAVSRAIRLAYRDRRAARATIDRLIALEPARLVIAHGPIVREDVPGALARAFAWLPA